MRLKTFICILLISMSAAASEKAILKRIFDGDTIVVISRGKYIKVRLIGIDTPETWANYKAKRDSKRTGKNVETIMSQGRQASAFLKLILHQGDTVSLEFDVVENVILD